MADIVRNEISHCHTYNQIKHPKLKTARKKLIIACVICSIFLLCEFIGGYLAGSLAILTDAAHLFTDFGSFMISLFSLYLAAKPPSKRFNFGWSRAEVLGALISIVAIWILTGILVYYAIHRIITREYEIKAPIMLVTATFGVIVNIIMGVVLHPQGLGHHGHNHGENIGHTHGKKSGQNMLKNQRNADWGISDDDTEKLIINDGNEQNEANYYCDPKSPASNFNDYFNNNGQNNDDREENLSIKKKKVFNVIIVDNGLNNNNNEDGKSYEFNGVTNDSMNNKLQFTFDSHDGNPKSNLNQRDNNIFFNNEPPTEGNNFTRFSPSKPNQTFHTVDPSTKKSPNSKLLSHSSPKGLSTSMNGQSPTNIKITANPVNKKTSNKEKSIITPFAKNTERVERTIDDKKATSLAVRAAYIHVLGDLVQSVGILIAAFIIYYRPDLKIADPICTFVFSFLVILTTLSILRDILLILMESVPRNLTYKSVKRALLSIPGIISIHDLKIWSLTGERSIATLHVVTDLPWNLYTDLQKCVIQMLHEKYNIENTTVQIEDWNPQMGECKECIFDPRE